MAIEVQSATKTICHDDMDDMNKASLEADFMMLLNFDHLVDLYIPHPVSIPYLSNEGGWKRYTPDGLIQYQNESDHESREVLVMLDYRKTLNTQAKILKPILRAVRQYAKERGWDFQVLTDDRIRTPLLENVRFLSSYRMRGEPKLMQWLYEELFRLQESTPKQLIESLYRNKWNQAQLIPSLWALVAKRDIVCNLTLPLTMDTQIKTISHLSNVPSSRHLTIDDEKNGVLTI